MYAECYGPETYREDLAYCEQTLADFEASYGPECAAAADSYIGCMASLTCEQFMQEDACATEYAALGLACAPEPGASCEALSNKYTECMLDGQSATYCQKNINTYAKEYGEECGQAADDYYACLSTLECVDLDMQNGCEDESSAMEMLCI